MGPKSIKGIMLPFSPPARRWYGIEIMTPANRYTKEKNKKTQTNANAVLIGSAPYFFITSLLFVCCGLL
jgi:hypothetical protein